MFCNVSLRNIEPAKKKTKIHCFLLKPQTWRDANRGCLLTAQDSKAHVLCHRKQKLCCLQKRETKDIQNKQNCCLQPWGTTAACSGGQALQHHSHPHTKAGTCSQQEEQPAPQRTNNKQTKQTAKKKKNSTYLNARLRELLNSISTGRSAVPAVMALMSASQTLLQPAGEGSHHQTAALTPLGSLTPKMSRMASCLCTHRHTALTQATTVLFCCLLSLHTSLGHRTLLGSLSLVYARLFSFSTPKMSANVRERTEKPARSPQRPALLSAFPQHGQEALGCTTAQGTAAALASASASAVILLSMGWAGQQGFVQTGHPVGHSSGLCHRPGRQQSPQWGPQPARPGPHPQAFVFHAEYHSKRPGEHGAAGNRLVRNSAGKPAEVVNEAINKARWEGKRTNPSELRHLPRCGRSEGSPHLDVRHREAAAATISASEDISD